MRQSRIGERRSWLTILANHANADMQVVFEAAPSEGANGDARLPFGTSGIASGILKLARLNDHRGHGGGSGQLEEGEARGDDTSLGEHFELVDGFG